ncbi:enoyl-CoA hydratase [Renibacterium salmoninarum ATCC 33209]|uniref:Enoyl-CoA hydratase n=1 Tax=Renibacterium salmoninarum (strain ATCC 33209 / DSM 20767 / JCM 11484 / NBRC 15589 / NCIMB 2235) TaxID=288705 RepID=A9WLH7_RENSM|nr:crotonase/enoyl-CoA hydratase family protein [Renibacterium salmoninarum]ABY21937.1 enoyl-CoA hydratase [Renibacterium salmoninarum ATCC 33209]
MSNTAEATTEVVLTEVVGNTLVITINRPKARNAVNGEVALGLVAALDQLENDAELRVGVVTGANGTFCAGMDLRAAAAGETVSVPGKGFAGFVEAKVSKPLIAAIEGYALGGGLEIALNCDLIVAAEGATLGLPEVTRGLIAGGGGVIRLPKRIPHHLAMEILLTGAGIDAARAHELGLANRVAPAGQALAAALELAAVVAQNAPLALAAVKEVTRIADSQPEPEAFAAQAAQINKLMKSADVAEGIQAFTERRAPQWLGK